MKRPAKPISPETLTGIGSPPDFGLSKDQLATMASIILTLNHLERDLDQLVSRSLGMPHMMEVEIVARLPGIEAKKDLVKATLKQHLLLQDADYKTCCDTLADLMVYKRHRDLLAHGFVWHTPFAITKTMDRKADWTDSYIAQDALNALLNRMIALSAEFGSIIAVGDLINSHFRTLAPLYRGTAQAGEQVQYFLRELRERQTQRRRLPPLPEFPDED